LENLKGRDYMEDLGIVGRNIKMNLEDMEWIQLAQDRLQLVDSNAHGNEPLVSMRGEEFLD
jgi:hypothetical protein